MDLIEFIGFVISMAALIFLSARRAREKAHPEEYRAQQEEEVRAYREMLTRLELPIPEELRPEPARAPAKKAPAPPRKAPAASSKAWKAPIAKRMVRPSFKFKAILDARHQKTLIEQRRFQSAIDERRHRFNRNVVSSDMEVDAHDAYAIVEENPTPRSQMILGQLKSPLEMVLFQEILGIPKALQKPGPLEGLPWCER